MENMLNDLVEIEGGLFYYITMKDFERESIKVQKQNSSKILTINEAEKYELHLSVKDKLENIFDFKALKQLFIYKQMKLSCYDELYKTFSSSDIFAFLKNVSTIDTFVSCSLVEGNFAWVSKSFNGHYRYFSKSKSREAKTISFDLWDLIEIYYGLTKEESVKKVSTDFKIDFSEFRWREEQKQKYEMNTKIIENINEWQEEFPSVYECLHNHMEVLRVLNNIGLSLIQSRNYSLDDNNIFFASNSYITKQLGNYTIGTTNKIVNILAVLGFIKKIKEKDIPEELLNESKMIAKHRNLGNIISYYAIESMEDVFSLAEERAKTLIECKLSYSNISRQRILSIFGEVFTDNIYVQQIQKNKKKEQIDISEKLEMNLLKLIDTDGFATKKSVYKKAIRGTKINEREKELNKIWKGLLSKHQLQYIKPTKQMMSKLKLKKAEYISIKAI